MRLSGFRRRTHCLLLLALTVAFGAHAAERPTYHDDVQPILAEKCVSCHQPAGADIMGMVAPMPLRTYDETRPWAKAIARAVKNKEMPPWHAAPEFHGVFKNERTLTTQQIDTIVSWAETGAIRGQLRDAEPATADGSPWTIGTPDIVVAFEEPYFVADWVEDLYVNVDVTITEEQLPEDRWIRGMQCRPGSEAVHHVVIYTDDYRDSFGVPFGMLGGVGPGTDATYFPEGYGRYLGAESTLTFNMHYHKEPGPGTGVYDQSEIAFTFHDKPVKHEVNWGAVSTMGLRIPPHAENHEVVAQETFRRETTLLALFPHMHLRGKAARYTAYYPDGSEEVLLDVPRYDFNWQTNYVYNEPKVMPAGTRLKVQMWYDNSEERAKLANIDPTRTVYWGEPTTSEMMFGWIDYTDTEVSD